MPLLENGRLAPDPWRDAPADAAPPFGAHVLLPLAVWVAARESVSADDGPLGVVLEPGDDVAALFAPGLPHDVSRLAAVAVTFPSFTDGRGFSQARRLRGEGGFTGAIRARGPLIPDQYLFLARCGVTALEIPADRAGRAEADWAAAVSAFDVFYQPAGDGRDSPLRRARGGGQA